MINQSQLIYNSSVLVFFTKYLFKEWRTYSLLFLLSCFSLIAQAQDCAQNITPTGGPWGSFDLLTIHNEHSYFIAENADRTQILYKSNGTTMTDISPVGGPWYVFNNPFIDEAGNIYFQAWGDNNLPILLKYDGTTMTDIRPAGLWREIVYLGMDGNGSIYVRLFTGSFYQLYKYDGMIMTNLTPEGQWHTFGHFGSAGTDGAGNIYFQIYNNSANQRLYKYNGTDVALTDITPMGGPWTGSLNGPGLDENGHMYFRMNNVDNDSLHLFTYDGTTMTDITPADQAFKVVEKISADGNGNSYLRFWESREDKKLYKSNGVSMTDITPANGPWENIDSVGIDKNKNSPYFRIYTDQQDMKLYEFNGTILTEITPANGPWRAIEELGTSENGDNYFRVYNDVSNNIIYKYDGMAMIDVTPTGGPWTWIEKLGADSKGNSYLQLYNNPSDRRIYTFNDNTLIDITPTGGPWQYTNRMVGIDNEGNSYFKLEKSYQNQKLYKSNGMTMTDITPLDEEWNIIDLLGVDGNGNSYFRFDTLTTNKMVYQFIPDNLCGMGTTYDCEEDQVNLENSTLTQAKYSAKMSLISQNIIATGTDVTFTAGDSITLKAGFEVKLGALFLAKIEDCTTALASNELAAKIRTEAFFPTTASTTLSIYPNPTDWQTTITFNITESDYTSLKIYNNTGTLLKSLTNKQWMEQGNYDQIISTETFQAGLHYVVLQTGKQLLTKKLLILK